jgi:hypothetical protein
MYSGDDVVEIYAATASIGTGGLLSIYVNSPHEKPIYLSPSSFAMVTIEDDADSN